MNGSCIRDTVKLVRDFHGACLAISTKMNDTLRTKHQARSTEQQTIMATSKGQMSTYATRRSTPTAWPPAPSPTPPRYVDGTTGSTSINYWKLIAPNSTAKAKKFLRQKGCRYPKKATQAVLLDLHSRAQRGLPRYHRFRLNELQLFCITRGLKTTTDNPGTKAQLIQLLQHADDTSTFPHFLDIPPELRVQIYTFHLQDLDPEDALPTQPPVTKVS